MKTILTVAWCLALSGLAFGVVGEILKRNRMNGAARRAEEFVAKLPNLHLEDRFQAMAQFAADDPEAFKFIVFGPQGSGVRFVV